MIRRARILILLSSAAIAACSALPQNCPPAPTPPPAPRVVYEPAAWAQLPGWDVDEAQEAWPAILKTCSAIGRRSEWQSLCAAAQTDTVVTSQDVRTLLERYLEPYRVIRQTGTQREDNGLITGYFEPQMHGSRTASAQFATPLYAPPPDLLTVDLSSLYPELKGKPVRARLDGRKVVPYYSRGDLAADPQVHGSELVFVDDALGAFLLEVQGSGRVLLPDGQTIRLEYADQNGYPYRSIGRYLVDHGELSVADATMAGIRQWVSAHPDRVPELLNSNPSVVFFREEPLLDPSVGPKGALGVPLTPRRSVAVDPSAVPLGAPVFLATTMPASEVPLERLVVAQDTGGAIRGAVRADFFWGTGPEAADEAGKMRQSGRLWLLWPKGAPLPKH
jgi:membrane-bound lytic murein transglycosylase A